MTGDKADFSTRAARAGVGISVAGTVSTMPPITPSTTFTGDSVEQVHEALLPGSSGFAYSRNANPTVSALESVVADLEAAEDAVVFGSGMAAVSNALSSLRLAPGDEIVASEQLYGVTRTLFSRLEEVGIKVHYVETADLAQVRAAASGERARVLFFETIANPLLQVADVAQLVAIGHDHSLTVIVDNTFATPYLLQPLALGVDISLNSATKYISGHGDVLAGVLAGDRSRMEEAREARTTSGAVLSPFEAWLVMRGIRTLPLRMERQSSSALAIANWLEPQAWIERVYYPGLLSSPYRDLSSRQFAGRFGGMVALDIRGDTDDAVSFMNELQLITPATSLGDVTSLVLYPPFSSHRTLSSEDLKRAGIGLGLIRLSVGLESPDDLIGDLAGAALRSNISASQLAPLT